MTIGLEAPPATKLGASLTVLCWEETLIEHADRGAVPRDTLVAEGFADKLLDTASAKAVQLVPGLVNAVTLVRAVFTSEDEIDLEAVTLFVFCCNNDAITRRDVDKMLDFNVGVHDRPPLIEETWPKATSPLIRPLALSLSLSLKLPGIPRAKYTASSTDNKAVRIASSLLPVKVETNGVILKRAVKPLAVFALAPSKTRRETSERPRESSRGNSIGLAAALRLYPTLSAVLPLTPTVLTPTSMNPRASTALFLVKACPLLEPADTPRTRTILYPSFLMDTDRTLPSSLIRTTYGANPGPNAAGPDSESLSADSEAASTAPAVLYSRDPFLLTRTNSCP